LFSSWEEALLFRKLATLRLDVPVFGSVEELRWKGPGGGFAKMCERCKAERLVERVKGMGAGS
jgi:hypothetical protein